MTLSPAFAPIPFSDLPGWRADSLAPAFQAFRRSAGHVRRKPYRSGTLGVTCASFAEAYAAALEASTVTELEVRAFFETFFVPARICPDAGEHGLVTGFYEPDALASPRRTARFRVPLLRRPADLIDIDDSNRPAGLDPYLAFGRETDAGLAEYFDRAAIERGALAGRDLEFAWLEDPVDAFFIHVQGAARLTMTDGSVRRITYAAKSGQRFTGVGRMLADLGEISLDQVTMQSIRAWFKAHPDRVGEILDRNRSYIFFRDAPADDASLGPIAAAKVQLTAGRSMAVDRLLHTFGTPIFIDAPTLTAFDARPFRRLMIAQDTGSAIVGAARGDLFAGTGDAAGGIAGGVKHPAQFTALLPKALVSGT